MGKEGINILNDVVYITASIMGYIEGKSREYYAILAAVLVQSAQMGGERGRLPPMVENVIQDKALHCGGQLPARMRSYFSLSNVPVRGGGISERTS
jgi:hypothetical protein